MANTRKKRTKAVFEDWNPKDLKEFPMQAAVFRKPSVETIDALAENIRVDGLKNRIEILSENSARVALRLYEIERNRDPGTLEGWDAVHARERVGEMVGMSGRNLDRYFRVLKTPMAVQISFDNGKLPLVVAEKVADVPPDIQAKIAERIEAGKRQSRSSLPT